LSQEGDRGGDGSGDLVAHNHDVLAAGDRRYADRGEHHPLDAGDRRLD
jgi:hypothetical protein